MLFILNEKELVSFPNFSISTLQETAVKDIKKVIGSQALPSSDTKSKTIDFKCPFTNESINDLCKNRILFLLPDTQ